ncbi:MAG: sialidase family protein [Planctomycetota bacterium]
MTILPSFFLSLLTFAPIVSVDDKPLPPGYTIPVVDLTDDVDGVITIDREKGQYLGHPSAVLLEDDQTVLCVYPKGHGKGAIVYKRSQDGGKSWSARLATPDNWASSKEVPTIHRVIAPEGTKRLIVWSGLYPARLAVSEDDGASWSPLKAAGDWGGIVVMGSVARLADGRYASWFHDDGRFLRSKRGPSRFDVLQTISSDGGLTWSAPISIAHRADVHLCEPGFVRSPDGKTIALLMRENSRTRNSFVIFSKDEGLSWSAPRELPAALTGDRHTAIHTGDGRLFISFRDTTRESITKGDWVGWVGKWQDIVDGSEGQYRVRLMDNHVSGDCAYPAILQQKDGTIIAITYGHWSPGESPWIACRRFTIDELDLRRAALEE